jgi:hypothetical protein
MTRRDAPPADAMADPEIVIPASAQEAEARLAELGPLATAVEWERACIVWALCKPGKSGPTTSSGSMRQRREGDGRYCGPCDQ